MFQVSNFRDRHENEGAELNRLKKIWEDKVYRTIPTSVLSHLRNDINLQDGAILCWMTLFELAYFDEEWKVSISLQSLSNLLGKRHIRTIQRWLKQLLNGQYVVDMHEKGGGTRYAVRFPQEIVEKILTEEPDRKIKSTKHNKVETKVEEIRQKSNKKLSIKIGKERKQSIDSIENQTKENKAIVSHDINVTTPMTNLSWGNDKSVIHTLYNNINNKINITAETQRQNSSTVVCKILEIEEHIRSLQQKRKKIEERLREVNQQLALPVQSSQRIKIMRNYNELDNERLHINNAIENGTKLKEKYLINQSIASTLEEKPTHFLFQTGPRQISEFQYHRLRKTLSELGFAEEKLNRLINEIIFEIRFGSLRNCQKTKLEMGIDFAINIALKLIREDRWQQPEGLQNHTKETLKTA